MRQFRTEAIILRRTNYGEADRILNLLTPEHGKVSAIAKGVRRPKSKLAGGLELFAVCDVTVLQGKTDMGVITSARIKRFYGEILQDYDRTQLAYEIIKQINKATETVTDAVFYRLLKSCLQYLGHSQIDWKLVELWFRLQMQQLLGQGVNLATDAGGDKLRPDANYGYNSQEGAFFANDAGRYGADHIKFLRLLAAKTPDVVNRVQAGRVVDDLLDLLRAI